MREEQFHSGDTHIPHSNRPNFAYMCRTNLFNDGCSSRKFFKARDVSIENFQNHFPYIKIHTWFWGLETHIEVDLSDHVMVP